MKKLIILVAISFISLSSFCQSYFKKTIYNNSNAENKYNAHVNIIGNPARGAINIRLSNPVNEKYDISLYSQDGEKVTSISYNHPGSVNTKTMYVPAGVSGLYYLVVLSSNEEQSIKVFIQ